MSVTYNYDYFVKDHLGNTRMVLTDEWQQDIYPAATLEDGALATEQSYYNINAGDIITNPATLDGTYANNNGIANPNPNSNTGATSAKMYLLNGATGDKTGLGITLRVMAGDNVSILGKSFWHSNGSNPANNYNIIATDLLTALAGTGAVAVAEEGTVTVTTLNNSAVTQAAVSGLLNNVPTSGNKPKAYVNWILFDEQFRPVAGSSGFDGVNDNSDQTKIHNATAAITKNGYLYVYCSNESNVDVFFDNLQVVHKRGPLLSEDHYYPHGERMFGICSSSAGKLENKKKYNGNELQHQEFSDGSGLEWYDFNARTYDHQIGRFMQIDPEIENDQERLTPYQFGNDDPIKYNDPTGKCPWCIGAVIGAAVDYASQVAVNRLEGKSWGESLTKVDGASIVISAVAGAASTGLSALAPNSVEVKIAVEVGKTAIDASESMAKQYNESGTISLKQTVTDVAANKIAGALTKDVKVNSDNSIKTVEKQLNRAERVAAGDPRSSGRAAAVQSFKNNLETKSSVNQATKQAASGAITNTIEGAANGDKTKVNIPVYNPSRNLPDATYKKPPVGY